METLTRFGYAAKGFVYAAVGILALLAAFNLGGKTTDTTGALQTIAEQPFGRMLLALIALGLFCYALWRLIQTYYEYRSGKDDLKKTLFVCLGHVFSGVAYLGVAANAGILAMGGDSSGGTSKQDWTALVMEQPLGRWLVGLAGAITIGVGFWRIYQAYETKFRKKLNLRELDPKQETWLVNISRFGIAARGFVFLAIGFFVIEAAQQYNPDKVRGLDGALLTLTRQPYGKLMLAVVAAGLVAYAVYLFIQARYRKIKIG